MICLHFCGTWVYRRSETPLFWAGSQVVGKVCFWNKLLIYYPYPPAPFHPWKAVYAWLALRPCKALVHTRPASMPGVNTGTGVPATCLGATPKARTLWLLAKSYKQGRLCQLNRAVARCNGTNSWLCRDAKPSEQATLDTLFYSQELFRQTDNLSLIQRNCFGDCLRIVLQKWKMLKILLKRIEKSREICYINCIWELAVSPKN